MTTKEIVKKALIEVYEKYKDEGLKSVYLYGSILTKDFNEKTSDVDSIGIAADSISVEVEDEIKNFLKEKYPQVNTFGFRFLYVSELNGGSIKGTLATFIHPSIHLLCLPYWEHVVGKSYSRENFSLPEITNQEAIKIEVKNNIIGWKWQDVSKIQEDKQMYFLKALAWIIYFIQKDRGINETFSYSDLLKNSQEERGVMEAILKVKKNNWSPQIFKENTPLFQSFINKFL